MTIRHKVLIIDDEPQIRRLINAALSRANYATVEAENARDALELVPLFKQKSDTTLIIVSARDATEEKVAALDLGADDYLTKPFDTDELLARVRVALRNRMTKGGGVPSVRAGNVEIDLLNRVVRKAGQEVHLTPKEYAVLAQLAQFPGRVITHGQIMKEVWPKEHEHHVEYLRVLVRTLRQKLEDDPQRPQIIGNELGIGYRLRFSNELSDG